jgi:hypothetical protein
MLLLVILFSLISLFITIGIGANPRKEKNAISRAAEVFETGRHRTRKR